MTRSRLITILLGLSLLLFGCVRREGRNSDCKWTSAPTGVDRRDLRADLEFAEELAIRYMEAHAGPRDQAVAAKAPTPEARRAVCEAVPLGRMGTTAEVADLATFLCSPAASYLTGAMYACDGGSGLAGPRSIPFQK